MQFLASHAQIPMSQILGTGSWGCGPYIVSTYIEGIQLSKCLTNPISDAYLMKTYRGMSTILLELYKLEFPRIGPIGFTDGYWKVTSGP